MLTFHVSFFLSFFFLPSLNYSNAKSMPDDVKEALADVLGKNGNLDKEQVATYIQNLERSKRFQVEAWS